MKEDIEKWMDEALALAQASGDDVPVGCLIIRQGEIIARGHNQRIAQNDPCGHAEIVALREAAQVLGSWRLDKTHLVVTLEPCPMCAEAIIQARVGKITFGAYDLVYGACGSAFNLFGENRTFPLPDIEGGIAHERASKLLKDFFKNRRSE